jgi:NAD(P)-dependent dehydrogenase (short-subunit alcohol dehydrogenase family)
MENSQSLVGKTTIVTGASRGIGLAIAHRIGRLGARVSLCARDAHRLQRAVESLRKEGVEAQGWAADVSDPNSVAEFIARSREAYGPIDILVNNAGKGIFRAAHLLTIEEWDDVMNTNLKSVFLMCREVAPEMVQRRSGQIINISSLAGKNAFAGGAAYCASKWGLLGLTHSMAEDLRDFGVRVSAVCPGSVATDFMHGSSRDSSKMLQPDDVAHAVEMILTQGPTSFLSEISIRPTQKP